MRIEVKATPGRVEDAIRAAAHAMAGNVPDEASVREGIMLRLGVAMLSIVKEAFVVRMRGGTDEAGLDWPPLAESTLRKRRRKHANVPNINHRELNETENRLWWDTYRREAMTTGERSAAAYAWMVVRSGGAKTATRIPGIGADILRDTSRLLASLSPALTGPENPDTIFGILPNGAKVGTNVDYAIYHHSDEPRKTGADGLPILPQRRLWADPSSWPESWWDRLASHVKDGIAQYVARSLGGG